MRVLLFVLLAAIGASSFAVESEPALFDGDELPAPTAQQQPWIPPQSDLPEKLVSAVTALFSQGLADPRGLEYREITVVVGSCWGDHGAVKTFRTSLSIGRCPGRYARWSRRWSAAWLARC